MIYHATDNQFDFYMLKKQLFEVITQDWQGFFFS